MSDRLARSYESACVSSQRPSMKIIGLDGSDFDWIGFTVVANLALTASGVGAEDLYFVT